MSGLVAFGTNDPDRSTLTLRVAGEGESAVADAGPRDGSVDASRSVGAANGGCGCRATQSSGEPLCALFVVLGLMSAARRRRRVGGQPK